MSTLNLKMGKLSFGDAKAFAQGHSSSVADWVGVVLRSVSSFCCTWKPLCHPKVVLAPKSEWPLSCPLPCMLREQWCLASVLCFQGPWLLLFESLLFHPTQRLADSSPCCWPDRSVFRSQLPLHSISRGIFAELRCIVGSVDKQLDICKLDLTIILPLQYCP